MTIDLFHPRERKILRRLTNPTRIQEYLDSLVYNVESGEHTCYSPREVMREGVAHCMEGAMFGALALRLLGHPPLVVDLEAVRDTDHVLAVYRVGGFWGAVGKSDYSGLRSREPVYRTIRELAMSYFEHYFNARGEKTLRTFSRPVNLRRFDRVEWMTREDSVWEIPNYLCDIPHTRILRRGMERRIAPMDARLYAAGRFGGTV